MQPKIARAIGTSHPARPEEGDDFVVSEPCAFREGQAHRSWRLEEPGPNIDKCQQRLDFPPQRQVAITGLIQESLALRSIPLQRLAKQFFYLLPPPRGRVGHGSAAFIRP